MKRFIKNILICLQWVIKQMVILMLRVKGGVGDQINEKRKTELASSDALKKGEYERGVREMEEMEKVMERSE